MMFSLCRRSLIIFNKIGFDSFYYINSKDNKKYFKNVIKFEDKDIIKYRIKISYNDEEEVMEYSFYMTPEEFSLALNSLRNPAHKEYFYKYKPDKRIIKHDPTQF